MASKLTAVVFLVSITCLNFVIKAFSLNMSLTIDENFVCTMKNVIEEISDSVNVIV